MKCVQWQTSGYSGGSSIFLTFLYLWKSDPANPWCISVCIHFLSIFSFSSHYCLVSRRGWVSRLPLPFHMLASFAKENAQDHWASDEENLGLRRIFPTSDWYKIPLDIIPLEGSLKVKWHFPASWTSLMGFLEKPDIQRNYRVLVLQQRGQ